MLIAIAVHAAFPSVAFAQDAPAPATAPPDTVYVTDGEPLRGTVREIAKGSHVVLELPDGRVASIPWGRIVRIEHAASAPLPSGAAGGAPRSSVYVHIDSPSPVDLETRGSRDEPWQPVCSSPCDGTVPAGAEYRITGSGVRASKPFRLATAAGGQIVLGVDPANTSGFVLGIVGTSIGGVTFLIGGFVLLAGALLQSDQAEKVGGVMFLGGGVLLGAGIAGVVGNARTGVDQQPLPTQPQGIWRTPSPLERSASGFVGVPLFATSF